MFAPLTGNDWVLQTKEFLTYDIEQIRSYETKEYILTIMKIFQDTMILIRMVTTEKLMQYRKCFFQVLDPENLKDFKTDLSDIPLCLRTRFSTTFHSID